MLSLHFIAVNSASILRAKSTLTESRFKEEYFTRKRKMPFEKLLRFMLSMYRTSSQNALNKFFENEGITMSQQALSKARSKFDHSPFQKLYEAVRNAAYTPEQLSALEKYDGKLLIAIDGSELRERFGGTGAKSSSPTARMSIAYDVLNDLIVDADFSPLSVSERTHAKNHINNFGKLVDLKDIVFIMDRGYASREFVELLSEKSHYLFRLRSKFNAAVDALPLGSNTIIMYDNVKVRIVKFELPSGEIETLMTNLFDLDESKFMELYFKRWSVEVKFDIVKKQA